MLFQIHFASEMADNAKESMLAVVHQAGLNDAGCQVNKIGSVAKCNHEFVAFGNGLPIECEATAGYIHATHILEGSG